MKAFKITLLVSAAIALSSCGLTTVLTSQNSQITTVLTQLANTATQDLNTQIAVANAATPPDVDGAQCGAAALQVTAAIQKVTAATQPATGVPGTALATPPTVGAFTTAEIASLYQPGSAQFNWAVKVLETGCIAKVHDINQAAQSTTSILMA